MHVTSGLSKPEPEGVSHSLHFRPDNSSDKLQIKSRDLVTYALIRIRDVSYGHGESQGPSAAYLFFDAGDVWLRPKYEGGVSKSPCFCSEL